MRNIIKMAEICEASAGARFFVTYRFIDKIKQVIFVLKKELYFADGKVKERLLRVRKNELTLEHMLVIFPG